MDISLPDLPVFEKGILFNEDLRRGMVTGLLTIIVIWVRIRAFRADFAINLQNQMSGMLIA
jgi:hypothetical protein